MKRFKPSEGYVTVIPLETEQLGLIVLSTDEAYNRGRVIASSSNLCAEDDIIIYERNAGLQYGECKLVQEDSIYGLEIA